MRLAVGMRLFRVPGAGFDDQTAAGAGWEKKKPLSSVRHTALSDDLGLFLRA